MSGYPNCEFEDCYCKRHYPNRSGGEELEVVDRYGEILIYCEVAIANHYEIEHTCAFCKRYMIGKGLMLKSLPEIKGKLLFLKKDGIFINSDTQFVSNQGRIVGKLVGKNVTPLKRIDYEKLSNLGIDVGESKHYCALCFDQDEIEAFLKNEEMKDPCLLFKMFPQPKKKRTCEKCGLNHSKYEPDPDVAFDEENVNELIKQGNVGVLKFFEGFFKYKQELKDERKRKKKELLDENRERAKKLIASYFTTASDQELQTIVELKSKDSVEKKVIERLMKEKNLIEFVKWLRA